MEPANRQRGVTWGDVGGLLAALFHAGLLLIGVAVIALGLLGWLGRGLFG